MLRKLLAAGVDLGDAGSRSEILQYALHSASLETIQVLVENGCDPI